MTRGVQEPQELPPGYASSLWDALLKNMETNTDFNLISFKIVKKKQKQNIEALLSALLYGKKKEVKSPDDWALTSCQVSSIHILLFSTSTQTKKAPLQATTRINNKSMTLKQIFLFLHLRYD